jgi:hypothetical protein
MHGTKNIELKKNYKMKLFAGKSKSETLRPPCKHDKMKLSTGERN